MSKKSKSDMQDVLDGNPCCYNDDNPTEHHEWCHKGDKMMAIDRHEEEETA
jgi:hypothetical protein